MDHNHKSGNAPVAVEFRDEFERISQLDDSLEPEVLREVTFVTKKAKATHPSTSVALEERASTSAPERSNSPSPGPSTSSESLPASSGSAPTQTPAKKAKKTGFELIAETLLLIDERKAKREEERLQAKFKFLQELFKK